jgi:hypothetical protein
MPMWFTVFSYEQNSLTIPILGHSPSDYYLPTPESPIQKQQRTHIYDFLSFISQNLCFKNYKM